MVRMVKRKGRNNWEIFYPLPADLRVALKTPALYRTLATGDRQEAASRYPARVVEVILEVTKLKQRLTQSPFAVEPKQEAQQELQKAANPAPQATTKAVLIKNVIEAWRNDLKPQLSKSTQEEYERAIKRLLTWSKSRDIRFIHEFDRKTVREFVSESYHGRSGKTVKLALGGLRGVWDHAFTVGWTEDKSTIWSNHNYNDRMKIGTGEIKTDDQSELPFSFDDIRTLLRELKPVGFKQLIALALITGARSSEIANAKRDHLSLREDGYWLDIHGTKTKSAHRRVPIPRAFDQFIESLINETTDGYLIPLYEDKEWSNERDRARYINKEINRKRRLLNLPNTRRQGIHSTRRTYIELLEGEEVPLGTIKLLVGHKRTDLTIGTYSKGTYVNLRKAAEHLALNRDFVRTIKSSIGRDDNPE
ncbi:tyrosine-type recombinase/integrase [Thalassospira sp. MIT1370]|uniref:tyrosine-type recombinase/integrase n=1 Tax=unclassified Thalassospira TaxID=2648997 RepID=UPI00399B3B04